MLRYECVLQALTTAAEPARQCYPRRDDDENVCHSACGALAYIAGGSDALCQAVVDADGLACIIAAMRAHAGSENVCHYACWALMNIAWNPGRARDAVRAGGGGDAARDARRRHSGHAGVQEMSQQLLDRL